MKCLSFLILFYLIFTEPTTIKPYYSNELSKQIIKKQRNNKLLSIIKNWPNPSQKLLARWLKIAFEQNYVDIIRHILLNTHINLKGQDKLGNTWLHYAVVLGNPEFVKILLKKDICRNKQNIFGNTALHDNAKYNPNLKIIKMLFMTGVNPDLENYEGETALDIYVNTTTEPNEKIIRMLKKHCICYFLP